VLAARSWSATLIHRYDIRVRSRALAAGWYQRSDPRDRRLGHRRDHLSGAFSVFLFTIERSGRMAEDAVAQEEGEWTIFWLTLAAVAFSFAAIISEFAGMKEMLPAQRNLRVILVAVTLFVSWLMTHATFAFRYAHEY
jgi:hypothetical protein